MADVDALIVGGGHNGLVAASYLARAGLRTLVLERREIVGGACVTEELFPGYRLSTCSYICHLLQPKVIDDLQLRQHGFETHRLAPERFHPFPDGSYLLRWDEDERTQEEIARVSPRDAAAYPRYVEFWNRATNLIYPYFLTAPPTLAQLAEDARRQGSEAVFERMLTASMKDLVEEYFEHPHVRALLVHAHDVGDPSAPGSVFCYTHIRCGRFCRPEDTGIPRGGMGTITQAMARAAQSFGAEIRTGAPVERLLVEQGRVIGVRLDDGTEIRSHVVVANADPKRTFLRLVGRENLPDQFAPQVEQLRTEAAYLKFHAALRELPDFTRFAPDRFDARWLGEVKICPSVEYLQRAWYDARQGLPARRPMMEVQIPSAYDASHAPPGHHVMSIWGLYAPVHPAGGTWDDHREAVGEALIDTLAEYAPNLRGAILEWNLFTPLDIERRVGMTDGNIRHLDTIPGQYLSQRPLPEWANYRTPIAGLYLCGAGTHPGGEVSGAPGHNAAHAVLGDLGTG